MLCPLHAAGPDERIITILINNKVCIHVKLENFTSHSRVTPPRNTRDKSQHLQQDERQHDVHFPRFIFRFDVAPHTHTLTLTHSHTRTHRGGQRVCASISTKSAEIHSELPSQPLY